MVSTNLIAARTRRLSLALAVCVALPGCSSDPSPLLARVNASILTHVACAGVDHRGTDMGNPRRAGCDAAINAEAQMDPAPDYGEVAVFNLNNPGPLLAAPGQPAGQVTVGPYKDLAACEAVRTLATSLGLSTYACESRYLAGKVMIAR